MYIQDKLIYQLANLAILIKLFTNYFQIISAIATFQLSLPGGIESATENVGNPVKSMAFSLDCFLIDASDIPILYFRMIWALCMPLFYLCIFLLGYFFAVLIKKAPYKVSIIYTTFIYMFIYLQPTMIGGFISLVSTRTLSQKNYVQADVGYDADSTEHQIWMGVFAAPLLILWAIIFPFTLLYLVYAKRNSLNEQEQRYKWGYFYNEYKLTAYFWEFVKIFQKELIILSLTFYEEQVIIKGLLIFIFVFVYGILAIIYTPYQSKTLTFLDIESTAICSISLIAGVLIYTSSQNGVQYLAILMMVIVVIINGFFILQMIGQLFSGYSQKFQDKLDKVRAKILAKKPDLLKRNPWLKPYLMVRSELEKRGKELWAKFRFELRKGFQRRKLDKNAPFLEQLPFKEEVESQKDSEKNEKKKDSPDEKNVLLGKDEVLEQSPKERQEQHSICDELDRISDPRSPDPEQKKNEEP